MRILMFGITQIAVKGLKRLISLNEKPVAFVVYPLANQDIENLKLICKENEIPVYCFDKINNPEFISIVKKEIKPDLLLTYTFPQKIGEELLACAKQGINMHPALLPAYRGSNPYFWTIANGETKTGITYHFLTKEFDAGDIILQQEIPILPKDTCGMVILKQEKLAADMLEELLKLIKTNAIKGTPQDTGVYPKAPKPYINETFIHWDWPTKKIVDRIRALNPFNGALSQYKKQLVAIYQATETHYYGTGKEANGETVGLTPDGPMVKCSNGAIIINILVVGKKYLLSGSDFIEYEKVKIGDKFIAW
ncbi:MAG: methionyl-tRNA formyltransferase [Candidatus Margulisbacteria bacterium]|nr:methionyl-tRNA formyltransferase [Candidatus Margulisiibacteriota bacterium]